MYMHTFSLSLECLCDGPVALDRNVKGEHAQVAERGAADQHAEGDARLPGREYVPLRRHHLRFFSSEIT